MASSSSSRTKVVLTAFSLFCCSLFLTAYSVKNPQIARIAYAAVGEIYHPLQIFAYAAFEEASHVWDGYIYLVNVRKENSELREKLRKLESEVVNLSEVNSENKRLSSLVNFVHETQLKGVVSRVVGFSASNWVRSVTLNRGSSDGINVDMAVVDGHGVVGQVIEVSPNTARVLLTTDATSGVDALLQESRARGVISGAANGRYVLKFVARDQEVKEGERVVTSGVGGIFPSGLLIGAVANIRRQSSGLFQEIEVMPAVDFSRLEEVLVVKTNTGGSVAK